jgi:hypothetical protein
MTMAPLKLLISSYALAGLAALGAAAGGAGAGASLLVFWLGGAAAVFALATLPGARRAFRNDARVLPACETSDEIVATLAELEDDRAADAPVRTARATG